ncbi:MAG: C4-dicarboxylate ABC transporter permease [Gammaproteobacteria bacterium]|nr:MAG: C4-dicarboxylate ABC transporter permease [Gammaproteobacteria bacterium]
MVITALFVMLFAFMLIGMPISFSLGLASTLTILFFGTDSLASLAGKIFSTTDHYTLMAIPFFILASAFLSTGGVARRMIDFAVDTVGHIRGGLAMASVMACMLFAAVSGSSPATVVAIGSIVIAGMVREGYPQKFAAGVISNAGTLGILIPPSIVMVVYAAATDVSVGRMFLAGIIPGLIAGLMLMVAIYFRARKLNIPSKKFQGFMKWGKSAAIASGGLFLIVIIMGGIYGGIFTPTEAAAVSAVYAFLVAVYGYKDLKITQVPDVLLSAGKTSIMLMFIIANAMLFAHVLTTERIPHEIATMIIGLGLPVWGFLIIVNILLLIAGNFMEPSAILLIMAPILFPIAMKLGIDPIHLGIIMVVNMEIGMITPPVGLNLFVTSGITGMPMEQVIHAALPWLMILIIFLIIVTYVPAISTFIPNALMGPEIITQ